MTDQDNSPVNFNLNDLTIGEIVTIEELTGLPFDAMTDPDKPKGKLLQAIAYISRRRENPEFTWEEAGALKINTTAEKVNPTEDEG